jgi:hypothetical protein
MSRNEKNEDTINAENNLLVQFDDKNKTTATTVLQKTHNRTRENKKIETECIDSNDYKHKFYLARLKHGLIISFLALIPIQSLVLCISSYFLEKVNFYQTSVYN